MYWQRQYRRNVHILDHSLGRLPFADLPLRGRSTLMLLLMILTMCYVLQFLSAARQSSWAVVASAACCMLTLATALLAWASYSQFGWRQYSKLVGDLRFWNALLKRQALLKRDRFSTFLKVDVLVRAH
jgi:hypothetical protein